MDNTLVIDAGGVNATAVDETLRRRLLVGEGQKSRGVTRIKPKTLRRTFDAVDAAFIGTSCLLVAWIMSDERLVPDLRRCLALSVLAIGVTGVARRALRPRGGSLFEPARQHAAIAAVSTGAGTCCAVLWWIVVFSDLALPMRTWSGAPAGHALLVDWKVAWVLLASAGSFAISLAGSCVAGVSRIGPLRVAVVGFGEAAEVVVRTLAVAPREAWQWVITADDRSGSEMGDVADLVGAGKVDAVVLAMGDGDSGRINAACRYLADSAVPICLGLDPYVVGDIPAAETGVHGPGLPLHLQVDPFAGIAGAFKRLFDVTGSLLLLMMLSPLLLLITAAIRIESKGPILFRQWRFGQCSRPILVFKFRTMYVDRGDPTGECRTRAGDPRVTRVGRFLRRYSIDELPQVLNVLRGDMSLVGPRPHPMHMKVAGTYYFEAVPYYRARHRVRPGITGWAQVNGSRGEVATLEQARRRVDLDLYYVNHWSLWLDLVILVRTLRRRVLTSGA